MSLLQPLLQLLPLGRLPRTGWILRGVEVPESIAAHVLGTAYVALSLAPRVRPPLDLGRTLALALLHDAPEALTGDLPRSAASHLPPGAKRALEERAAEIVLDPLDAGCLELWREFQDQATREARFVRLCDKLQLGVELVGLERAGRRGLGEFQAGIQELDCTEFPGIGELQREILDELRR